MFLESCNQNDLLARLHDVPRFVLVTRAIPRFLARLYESTGRAIAVTPASASASVSASALALASALLKC